ncbi:hypothetical protein FRC02_009645, partial [Tulasnella sp. 418]
PELDWESFKHGGPLIQDLIQVTASQWERFISFSAQVRTLEDSFYLGYYSLMDSLAPLHCRYGGHLLPNVQRITISEYFMPQQYPFIADILSHRLRSFNIIHTFKTRDHHEGREYDAILGILEKQSPNLQELKLRGHDRILTFSSFDSFTHLTSLELNGDITPGALLSIIHCTVLRRLSLVALRVYEPADSAATDENISRLLTSDLTLNSLEDLEIGAIGSIRSFGNDDDVGVDVGDILERLLCPNVKHVTIVNPHGFMEQLLRWIRKLSKGYPKLTKVTVLPSYPLKSRFLEPLATIPKLQHLTISDHSYGWQNILPPTALEDCLSSLPDLQGFEWLPFDLYRSDFEWAAEAEYMDIEALPGLLHRCPKLTEMTLMLNAKEIKAKLQRIEESTQASQEPAESDSSLHSLRLIIFKLDPADVELLARIVVRFVSSSTELSILVTNSGKHDTKDREEREDEEEEDPCKLGTIPYPVDPKLQNRKETILEHEFSHHVARLQAGKRERQ